MGVQELHNNMKTCRQNDGLTQASLAEKVGVTRKTINTIENGVFVPSTILALKIAAALNSRVEDVFMLAPISKND